MSDETCGVYRVLPDGTRLTCLLRAHMPSVCVFANDPWWRRAFGRLAEAIPVERWLRRRRALRTMTKPETTHG